MKIKINKAALTILLSSIILVGCESQKKETIPVSKNDEVITEKNDDNVNIKTEKDLIDYFVLESDKLEKTKNSEPLEKFKEKCYDTTTMFGDFILEGKVIHGYTFENISDESKEIITKLSVTTDSKIVEYFPEYKEYISGKIVQMKRIVKDFTLDIVGEDNYEIFGLKKDEIVTTVKDGYETTKEKVKDKYKDFKNNHQE